jgi:hypothetical protein
MAFILNSTNLKNKNGGQELPATGILVRFVYHTSLRSFAVANDMRYYINQNVENDWDNLSIVFDDNGTKIDLPSAIYLNPTIQDIGNIEVIINQVMANEPTFIKTLFGHHYLLKTELEKVLGPDTVDIRLDLV